MVLKYSKWRYAVLKANRIAFDEEEPEAPWNVKECIVLRAWVTTTSRSRA
jgi:hypothetical protein